MKQMFDMSEKLMTEQSDEIFGVSQLSWEDSPWRQLSLIGNEEVISLSHAKVLRISDSVLCLGKMNEKPQSNTVWEGQVDVVQESSSQYRILDTIDGEPLEYEWNVFQIHHIAALQQSPQSSCQTWAWNQKISQDGSSSCRCSTTSHRRTSFLFKPERFSPRKMVIPRTWFRKEVVLLMLTDHKVNGTESAELLMIKFGESGHPIFRATGPLSRGQLKKQRRWKIIKHTSALMKERLKLIFAQLFSVNQLSIYGAVSDLCEEYKACHVRTGRPCYGRTNLTHCFCRQIRWLKHLHLRPMILHKKIYCKSTKNEWKGYHNKIVW